MRNPFVNRLNLCVLSLALWAAWGQLSPGHAAEDVFIPSFFDPARRLAKPEMAGLKLIRFLTEDDFPPFHFTTPDGTLTGFDVEIARAVCEELKLPCTIQPRRFETLVEALLAGEGDALIAGMAKNAQTRTKLEFSAPYYRTPARFVTARTTTLAAATPEALAFKTIGVEQYSAHEAYLKAFFPKSLLKTFDGRDAVRAALKRGDIDALFGDGISLSFWLNGADAGQCCRFAGGAYTESAYFGEGVSIGFRREDVMLRRAIDYALQKITEKGLYTDLYLKYFPVGFY